MTKIAESPAELNFPAGGSIEMEVNGRKICVSRYQDQLYACSAKCPHASAGLAYGHVDALGNIVCPFHRYKFSLETGRNTSGEGYFLKTFKVEVRDDGVFVNC